MIRIWCKSSEVSENARSLADRVNKDHHSAHNHMIFNWMIFVDVLHAAHSLIQPTSINMVLLSMKEETMH